MFSSGVNFVIHHLGKYSVLQSLCWGEGGHPNLLATYYGFILEARIAKRRLLIPIFFGKVLCVSLCGRRDLNSEATAYLILPPLFLS